MFRCFHISVLNRYWFVGLVAVGVVAGVGFWSGVSGFTVVGCAITASLSQ
jgi:hypothetical protein